MAQSKVQDMADWSADVGEGVFAKGQTAWTNLSETVLALPYVAIGSVSIDARRTGAAARRVLNIPYRMVRAAAEVPGEVLESARRAPARIAQAFEEREEIGRTIVERVTGRAAVGRAKKQLRAATKKAGAANTSFAQAARATVEAAGAATAAALDPRDTRSYEERTREELYTLACERDIGGRSSLTKKQLIKALRDGR
jgi:hypothetical protein